MGRTRPVSYVVAGSTGRSVLGRLPGQLAEWRKVLQRTDRQLGGGKGGSDVLNMSCAERAADSGLRV